MNNFSVDYAGLYLNWANTSLFIIPGTLPTLKLPIKSHPSSSYFSLCSFSIKLSWLQRRSNKINTILYDRYYLQNYKAITIKKIGNFTKYKNLIFQVVFIFSDWVLIKQITVSSTPFCCWGKQIFERMLSGGMSNFLLPRA